MLLIKIWLRFFDKKSALSSSENLKYCETNKTDVSMFCKSLDKELWLDCKKNIENIDKIIIDKLKNFEVDLGGGSSTELLFFLTRYSKPDVVLETGVASGISSFAFLEALSLNKKGELYSSDLPYFRLEDPEKFIGCVVPDHLKNNWKLFIKGDLINFKEILGLIKRVDIFHYDSDKSYLGRSLALTKLEKHITESTWIIFDDIQDNSHFFELCNKETSRENFIFKVKNKFLGVLAPVGLDIK